MVSQLSEFGDGQMSHHVESLNQMVSSEVPKPLWYRESDASSTGDGNISFTGKPNGTCEKELSTSVGVWILAREDQ